MLLNKNNQSMIELTNGVTIREDKYLIKNELENVENNLKLLINPINFVNDNEKLQLKESYQNKLEKLKTEYYWAQQVEVNPSLIKTKFSSNAEGKRLLRG